MDRLLHTPQTDRRAENHTPDQIALPEGAIVEVVRAERLSDYKVRLNFSDGAERVVDFEPFLSSSQNPMIRAYLDPQKFEGFRLEHGDLIWDDYELCFPIANLYEGRL
ncbi:MAG TPA: DUF2442 domain-containing protein [Blastocatellia bacterium]|nr:DUF2442 domain-containing protein [Blastocatellia bacterium]